MSVDFHFLRVGAGDCTIVHFPARSRGEHSLDERIMMVDINQHDDHELYEDVLTYYKTHFRESSGKLKPIFRLVCTHPHQDHICGLAALLDDPEIEILNFWDLDHGFVPEDFDHYPNHEADWKKYKSLYGSQTSP